MVVNENRSSISFTLEGLSNRWYRFDPTDSHFISYYNFNSSAVKALGFNDVPFANDIGSDFKDFSQNNFIIKSPTGLRKKRPNDAGIQYDEVIFANDYLLIDKSDEFSLGSTNFTIDIRVKPTNLSGQKQFLVGTMTKSASSTQGWAISTINRRVQFNVDGSVITESQEGLILNEWNHVAITRNSAGVQIWINGKLSSLQSTQFNDLFEGSLKIGTTEDITIFPRIGNKLYNFHGALSCLRIIKGTSLYLDEFEVPEPVLSLTPETILLTIQEDPGTINLLNPVPDPLTKTVYFYNQHGHLLDNIKLPSPPCQIERFVSDDGGFFIVSCRDKRLYKITLDKRVINKDYLLSNDGKNLEWLFQLPFETDVAFVGSFTTFARLKNNQINIGQPNSISMSNGKIWVGGFRKMWQLDKYFNIIREFTISGTIVGIKSLGDKCAAIIKNENTTFLELVMLDSSTGLTTLVHTARWLSDPVLHRGSIFISDSAARALIKVNVDTYAKQTIGLENNTPSYISANSTNIFISCHDNNRVLIYSDDQQTFTGVYFPEKVTWVSPLENSFIVSHYLKDISVLSHSRPSIIYEPAKTLRCGTSHVSSLPFKIKNLGSTSYVLDTQGAGVDYWVDGITNGTIKHGAYVSLSKKITTPGYYHIPVLIGDVAVDFKAISAADAFYPKNITLDPLTVESTSDIIEVSFQYKHEFVESFNSAYKSSVYGSVNYGFLKKNFSVYTGESKINDGDIISLCVPFGNTIPNTVITLTLGSREFLIPINNKLTVTNIERQVDKSVTSLIAHNFNVTTAGKYFIPSFVNSVGNLRVKTIDLVNYDAINSGGEFDPGFPLLGIKNGVEAFVPLQNGLFDVYINLDYPVVVNSILLKTSAQPEIVQEVNPDQPTDEDGNPNYLERKIFRKTPVNFTIKASNDLASWDDIATFQNVSNSEFSWIPNAHRRFDFENNVAYKFWRFANTTTQELGVSVNSILFEGTFPAIFSLKINGQPETSFGQKNLSAGDNLSISISTNDRLYDSLRYFIAGPENFELFIRTKSKPTINTTLFAEINEPTLRQDYISESKEISLTPARNLTLHSYDPFLLLSKNNQPFGQSITINNGDSLRLKKTIRNIFDSSSIVYDKQVDDTFNEYINVDVISLSTKNVVLSAAERTTNSFPLIDSFNVDELKSSMYKTLNLSTYAENENHYLLTDKFDSLANQVIKRSSFTIHTFSRFTNTTSIVNRFVEEISKSNSLTTPRFLDDFVQVNHQVTSSALINTLNYYNFLSASRLQFINLLKNYSLTLKNGFYKDVINTYISDNFDFSNYLSTHLISDNFEFIEQLNTLFSIDRFSSNLNAIQHFSADNFDFTELTLSTLSINRLQTVVNSIKQYTSFRFGALPLMRTPIFINGNVYNNLIHNFFQLQKFGSLYDRYHKIFFTSFNFKRDSKNLHMSSPYEFIKNIFPDIDYEKYIATPSFSNFIQIAVDYDKLLSSSELYFEPNPTKLNQNFLFITPQYELDRIITHNILNYVSRIELIRPNYILNVNFQYDTFDKYMYIFKQDGYYGFFSSQSEAIAEANRKKHAPFLIYKIPDTNKWTYKREYYFLDGCSISDGRIKRLVQGG